jgi:hypothetical protein
MSNMTIGKNFGGRIISLSPYVSYRQQAQRKPMKTRADVALCG